MTLSFLRPGTAHALALGATPQICRGVRLCPLQFIRTLRWRPELSRLDRPLGHDDGVAADGRGNEAPGGDLGRELDEAPPGHRVALLDRGRRAPLARAAAGPPGKGRR